MKNLYIFLLSTMIFGIANAQNTWTQKASVGSVGRSGHAVFSVGNKGYVGLGYNGSSWLNDLWEYDPTNNTWTQKANFGGPARSAAVGFSIGTKGYMGTGLAGSTRYSDLYEYDPPINT